MKTILVYNTKVCFPVVKEEAECVLQTLKAEGHNVYLDEVDETMTSVFIQEMPAKVIVNSIRTGTLCEW